MVSGCEVVADLVPEPVGRYSGEHAVRSPVRRDDAGTDALLIVPAIPGRIEARPVAINNGAGMASLPQHLCSDQPCNGRADAICANDQVRCDRLGLAVGAENDGATDAPVRIADQSGQGAIVSHLGPSAPSGIHERAVQQGPARRIERLDAVTGPDIDLEHVVAVVEGCAAHRGSAGRYDPWQQAPAVELRDPPRISAWV